jgi:hypothetical protein
MLHQKEERSAGLTTAKMNLQANVQDVPPTIKMTM